jgi:hypothetical protein
MHGIAIKGELQWKRRQGGRARRIHADTLPQPVRDEASQGSTASAETQARWPSEKDSCRHTATASPMTRPSQGPTASAGAQAGSPSSAA